MICAKPFFRFGISAHSYFFCCVAPLTGIVSYYEESIEKLSLYDIWFNVGQKIRDLMLVKGYEEVCEVRDCSALVNRPPKFLPDNELTPKQRENWEKLKYLQEGAYPNEIELILGLFCNMRCIHCSQQKYRYENKMFLLDVSDRLREELTNFLSYAEQVIIIGGEPTISPIYYDMLDITRKAQGAKIKISTNGQLIRQQIIPNLDIIRWVDISVDAASEETYNKIRKGGDWNLLLKGINELSKYDNVRITINNVISSLNYHEMPDMIEFAHKYNANVFFDCVRNYGNEKLDRLFSNYFSNKEKKQELIDYIIKTKEKAEELDVKVVSFLPDWSVL